MKSRRWVYDQRGAAGRVLYDELARIGAGGACLVRSSEWHGAASGVAPGHPFNVFPTKAGIHERRPAGGIPDLVGGLRWRGSFSAECGEWSAEWHSGASGARWSTMRGWRVRQPRRRRKGAEAVRSWRKRISPRQLARAEEPCRAWLRRNHHLSSSGPSPLPFRLLMSTPAAPGRGRGCRKSLLSDC